ncbi:hypothetical protein OH458_00210 [Vibrio sp. MarTm2]|uniref:hypothetical protein n=1 Tax=Vibrio sp. MarTm2 TaxID=2998831 RepID=UPI0022CD6DF4|nr:hypothetical protein [Vibrio sp. MarTm2]MDA0126499.1 hypothetical protein [Vibrio sp. MarTm2]
MKFLFVLFVYGILIGLGLILAGSIGCYFGYTILGGGTIFLGVVLIVVRMLLEGLSFQ